ncbi:type I polyketide synthase [Geodermatophilus maliterrae]|uniref:Beta-ketoacyl synthase N-terminal-like domain-containing protein n=1 Tax=Geodermatophilus maliterrae TaxID=3162531 RepID=A0ABV3XIX1_9ACTN
MDSPDPVAVVGMSCRFAGGIDSPGEYWDLLREGGNTIGRVPEDRWRPYAERGLQHAAAVRDATPFGAFLDDVRGFDAEFFGITPREAALMDPQQRIVLELAWEALEDAGIPPRTLAGTDTGVYMGVGADDYGRRLLEDLPGIEAWTGIGGSLCAVANRVSYTLDLRGPSMTTDTACSSSLVAVHLAVTALRAGECRVALAGGVLVMASPALSLVLDAAGATAPDGRCKSFDAAADGYGRGEGGGVVVLKRLADARRDGDRVLAVIRGSAVHQDGRTQGIMAPSGAAQAHLMRRVCERSGIDPATVDYVEAHGTGTKAGDPLEAGAIAEVFGAGRTPDRPCLIGSVKPNIGHLEAGAGVAGVIKTVLALRHGEIPASLNCPTPDPAIPWATNGLRVVTDRTPWPESRGPRRAGVSSYGYGGTIAHVLLEAADEADGRTGEEMVPGRPAVFPLSAASPAALQGWAGRLAARLGRRGAPATAGVGRTLARHRDHLPVRAAVVAADREQLARGLAAIAAAEPASITGTALPAADRGLVWVFSGQGSQWTGMGRELLATDPCFAEVVDALEPVFLEELGSSLREAVLGDGPHPTDVVQPMIFAMGVALAATWRARGIVPDAVIGHSVGEIAAAVTAGVLSLEDGARLVCRRSVLLRRVVGQGAMAWVGLSPDEARRRLGSRTDVVVAVASSPASSVVSGDVDAVEELCRQWAADGIDTRRIDSDVAFHSPQMESLASSLAEAVSDLRPGAPVLRSYSSTLPDPRSRAARDGSYWAANLRGVVRFQQAVTAAVEDGYRLFVEVSPHPVVTHSLRETLDSDDVAGSFVGATLRRHRPERRTLLENLAALYCHGAGVDWSAAWPGGAPVEIPTTVWQHRPHWVEEHVERSVATRPHDPRSHTVLGGRSAVHGSSPAQVWRTRLDRASRPYPGEHPVRGVEILPAAVLIATFLAAASSATGEEADLADVTLRTPVSLTDPRDLQVVLQDRTVRLSSRPAGSRTDEQDWLTHTTAVVVPATAPSWPGPRATLPEGSERPGSHVEDRLAALGVAGMGFPWALERLRCADGALTATVWADPGGSAGPGSWAPVLDAVLSAASVVFPGPPVLRMPAHVRQVTLAGAAPGRAAVTVRTTGPDVVDVEIATEEGATVGVLLGLRYGTPDGATAVVTSPRRTVHELCWRPRSRPHLRGLGAPTVLLVGPDTPLRRRLAGGLAEAGRAHRVVEGPAGLRTGELTGAHAVVVVPDGAGAVDDVAHRGAWLLASTAQRMAGAGAATPGRLWCVTEGVREALDERAVGYCALWGIGRVVGGEHPDLWGGIVDLGGSVDDVPLLLEVLGGPRGEDVVAVRDGEQFVARLHRPEGEPHLPPVRCSPDGTYVITGGLGVLGRQVALWLADRGMRRVVLAGRRALPPRHEWHLLGDPETRAQVDTVRSLERLGVTVVTVAVDVADAPAARALLDAAALGLPPVRGVVHAAGVLDDRVVRRLDEGSLRTVLRPKVGGALVLHEIFPPGSVDFFVLFSSCGQLLGLPGQGSYAAGNAVLDALAVHRRARGDRGTTSLGWTSWRGLGMSTSSAVIDHELAARGTGDITSVEAFEAWEFAERHGLGCAAVLRTVPLRPGDERPALLSELEEGDPEPAAGAEGRNWPTLSGEPLREALAEEVASQVSAETRFARHELDRQRPLVEMGLDSVMTVQIRLALQRRFGVRLPSTVFWDHPTIDSIATLLAGLVVTQEAA